MYIAFPLFHRAVLVFTTEPGFMLTTGSQFEHIAFLLVCRDRPRFSRPLHKWMRRSVHVCNIPHLYLFNFKISFRFFFFFLPLFFTLTFLRNRFSPFCYNANRNYCLATTMVTVNVGMLHYLLDHVYGAFVHRTKITPQFFSGGWGGTKLDMLEKMIKQLFPEIEGQILPPTVINPVWRTVWETKSSCLREASFRTPCADPLFSALPPESQRARVAFLTPKFVPPHKMACVVHLAGTGDHTFERRLRLGGPLLKENIATMVLESPFYGQRRPMLQRGAKLLCVSDLLLLGRATIEEARSLLHWLDSEAGFGKMGICGLSMGGVHAAMVGALHPTPIATLPFLSPHSAVVAFCEGILKHATAWEALRNDLAAQSAITLEEVRERLKDVLSLTDVTRFPIPKNPNAVIFVAATDDGYIPKHSALELQRAWPGSELRWVTGGHVSSFLLHNDEFRKAIVDGLNRLQWKESIF